MVTASSSFSVYATKSLSACSNVAFAASFSASVFAALNASCASATAFTANLYPSSAFLAVKAVLASWSATCLIATSRFVSFQF